MLADPRRPIVLLAAVVAAAALVLASCTSSDDSGKGTTTSKPEGGGKDVSEAVLALTADDYTEALKGYFTNGSTDRGDLVIADGEAACVAPRWVEIVGVDALHEHEITTDALSDPGFSYLDLELDEASAQRLIDVFEGCGVDIYAELAMSMAEGLTDEQRACAASSIDRELGNALLLTAFSTEVGDGSTEFDAVLTQLAEVCDLPF